MYYKISPCEDDDGDMLGFIFNYDHPARSFHEGIKFTSDPDAPPWQQHPVTPIRLDIKPGRDKSPMPSFLSMPQPIMSRQLLTTLKEAGVTNIDAYPAELFYSDGSLASTDYYVVNVIGAVAAVDLAKSSFNPDQGSSILSMSFDSVTIDPEKAEAFLLFRLAENITTIVAHENVKKAVESAKIPLISFYQMENVALL